MGGRGTIFSWVRYHTAFIRELEAIVPYVVLSVTLDDGPRVYGRLTGREGELRIGAHVQLVLERWGSLVLPAFELTGSRS